MKITYKDWEVIITEGLLTIEKLGEVREYDLPDFETIIHDYEYIYITLKDWTIYQYKMEVDNFFAGDMFDKEGNHIDVTACHVFGEE